MQANDHRTSALAGAVAGLSAPVLYAGLTIGGQPRLLLHAARAAAGRRLRDEAETALARLGIDIPCEIRAYDPRRLANSGSIEALVRPFKLQTGIHDPTGSVMRARAVVCCGRVLRARLGDRVGGLYLDPTRRTLYIVLDRGRFLEGGEENRAARREALLEVANSVRHWRTSAKAFDMPVRVGYRLPPGRDFVPVDEASRPRRRGRRALDRLRPRAALAGLAALVGLGLPATAMAEGPAVSAPNGKVSAQGGVVDGDGGGIAVGSFSLPLGHSFGAQLDGAAGIVDSEFYYGVGGHLFWRDPEMALIGLTATHVELDDIDLQRYGGEAELYLGQITLGGRAAYQTGEVEDGFVGSLNLGWYATDDLLFSAGGEFATGDALGRIGVEFQPGFAALPGLSFFADGEIGEDNYERVFAGVRYYFGATKTLKLRHRQDDPGDLVTEPIAEVTTVDTGGGGGDGGDYGGEEK